VPRRQAFREVTRFVILAPTIRLRPIDMVSWNLALLRHHQHIEPTPAWRYATNINENNVWFLKAMDNRDSVRDWAARFLPANRVTLSEDNRELRVTLTSGADLEIVELFLSAHTDEIEPEQKSRIDAKFMRLRQVLTVPSNLFMLGQHMLANTIELLSFSVTSLTRVPLLIGKIFNGPSHQDRLENIKAHPQFTNMVTRMIKKGTLIPAENLLMTDIEDQFDEYIAKWLDPVYKDLFENPVKLMNGKTLVNQSTFDIIMNLAEDQRIDPTTRDKIPPDYKPAKDTIVINDIRKFLTDCEQELLNLEMEPSPQLESQQGFDFKNMFW